ncbi:MAG: CYTH domain-containing protein [Paludibacteraceae bacterium]|nr:CYTH domain-containing protein [Paludibacteraceae bacterium]
MQNIEIERKFLVLDESYKSMATEKHTIEQGYLCKDPDKTVRVRIWDDKGFLTIKSAKNQVGFSRFEWEREISLSDAKELMSLALPGKIEKTRWIIPATRPSTSKLSTNELDGNSIRLADRAPWGRELYTLHSQLKWEIDEFHGRLEGFVMAEIELGSEDEKFDKPTFIGAEVTGNPRYYNANM